MKPERVFLGLGANLGDRFDNLRSAIAAVAARPDFELLKRASIYESPAVGACGGPDFLNTAIVGLWTGSGPEALLDACLAIERNAGRVRTVRDAPRALDIDLLFWDHRVIRTGRLQVPHPRLHERAFALLPLLELAPDLRFPDTGRPLAACLTPEVLSLPCGIWRPEAACV